MMTIEELVKEFELWRNNRKTQKEPIPPRLWKATVEAARITSPSEVAKMCGVAVSKIKKRMGVYDQKRTLAKKINFQKLPDAQVNKVYLELTTPSGTLVKIY